MRIKGFYFITDSALSRKGNISDVKNALKAGVKIVQYREKYASTREMYAQALILRKICRKATFIVNDRVDIALAVGADGVHLGSQDMPYRQARKLLGVRKIIGLTVHSLKEARQAQNFGVDYIGVSPIFSTKTKADAGRPKGIGLIRLIKKEISLPIVAIGGIDLSRAKKVIDSGADALVAISAVVKSSDVSSEAAKFQSLFYPLKNKNIA